MWKTDAGLLLDSHSSAGSVTAFDNRTHPIIPRLPEENPASRFAFLHYPIVLFRSKGRKLLRNQQRPLSKCENRIS